MFWSQGRDFEQFSLKSQISHICLRKQALSGTALYNKDLVHTCVLNPLMPSVSISILLTGHYTFVVGLIGRSCSNIKTVHSW